MAQQQFTRQYRNNAGDLDDLTLWTKNNQGKFASWRINVYGNKVRIKVYPAIEGDNKQISAVLSPRIFYSFLSLVRKVINTPSNGPSTFKVVVKRKGNNGPVTSFELYCGRNEEGVIWVSLYQHDRPKIAFQFTDDNYTNYQHTTGESFTKGEISGVIAEGYITMFENLTANILVQEYVDKEEGNNNNNNRRNNNNGNNNSSNNNSYDDVDDDVPF